MKIGITLHPYGEDHSAGLGEYILSLSKSLVSIGKQHEFVFFVKGTDYTIPDFVRESQSEWREVNSKRFWLDAAMKQGNDIDVWLLNTPIMPFFRRPKKSVVIALDFGNFHLEEPGLKKRIMKKVLFVLNRRALHQADQVVTISEYTRQDLFRWFPEIPQEKVSTVMAGFRDLTDVVEEPLPFDFPETFFVSVGAIKYRKNQLNVVKAFLRAKANGLKGSLLVCGNGSGEYLQAIKAAVSASEYGDSIVFTGYVTDGQLVKLYRNAQALVFPSRLEGFGFPILEAMSLGLPVITTNGHSTVEVAGGAALLVEPDSIEEICNSFFILNDFATRQKHIKLGEERIKIFSWKATAEKVIQALVKV